MRLSAPEVLRPWWQGLSMDQASGQISKQVLFEDDVVVVDDEEFALTVEDVCKFLEAQAAFRELRVRYVHTKYSITHPFFVDCAIK